MIIFDNVVINLSEWILNLFFLGAGMFMIIFSSITLVMFLLWITGGKING
tara:strand:- start:1185 stop:1334 length:150 start_codon:yes stop_codon:yes gene_type:complete